MVDNKLAWVATGFACVAAVVQPFVPVWLFVGLIWQSVCCTVVGWVIVQRQHERFVLEQKMEAAFGIKQ